MLPPAWIMVSLHLWVGPKDYCLFPVVNTLNELKQVGVGKPLDSHMIYWEYLIHLNTPTTIG